MAPQAKLWMLVCGLAVCFVGVWLGPIRLLTVHPTPIHISWWILAPIFFFTNQSGVRWYMKRTSLNSGIPEVPYVLALFFGTPTDLAVGLALGQAAVEATRSLRIPWRMGLAMGLHLLVMSSGYFVFRTLLPHPSALDPKAWPAVLAALAILNLRIGVVTAVMEIDGKPPAPRVVLGTVAYSLGSASVGMLTAVLIAANPTSLIWLLPVVAAVGISTRIHGAEHSQRQALEILAGVSTDLDTAIDFDSTMHVVVARLRRIFRARVAQITICPAHPGAKAYRTTVSVDGTDEVVSPGVADLSQQFLDHHRHGLIVAAGTSDGEAQIMLDRHEVGDALVVPIVIRNQTLGYIFIGGHTDEKDGRYRNTNLTVLQSMASQTAQLLQNRQLEKALADLSERETELTYRAFHDPLTGLPNRALFMDRLTMAHDRQARGDGRVTVARIDLDDLAAINRRYGRAAGDYVLVTVAGAVRGILREGETAARFGGDEFALAFEDGPGVDNPPAIARRILGAISEPKFYGSETLTVTASVGLTVIEPSDQRSIGDFIADAERALADAKAQGKNRCVGLGLELNIEGTVRHTVAAGDSRT